MDIGAPSFEAAGHIVWDSSDESSGSDKADACRLKNDPSICHIRRCKVAPASDGPGFIARNDGDICQASTWREAAERTSGKTKRSQSGSQFGALQPLPETMAPDPNKKAIFAKLADAASHDLLPHRRPRPSKAKRRQGKRMAKAIFQAIETDDNVAHNDEIRLDNIGRETWLYVLKVLDGLQSNGTQEYASHVENETQPHGVPKFGIQAAFSSEPDMREWEDTRHALA